MTKDDRHAAGQGNELEWQRLLRLRWPLGTAIALAFAVGQLLEILFLDPPRPTERLLLDVIGWGLLGGLAVWLSLTWVSRREQRYQDELQRSLAEQHALNLQLQHTNANMALLVEVNQRIAASATVDEVLDAAIDFPQRLVPGEAAALLLTDPAGSILTRAQGASAEELARLRTRFGLGPAIATEHRPRVLRDDGATCLVLPLNDGVEALGWIEIYRGAAAPPSDAELALIATIADEIAEAIVGVRRRSREERAIYQLERAIADERARIARDIHDGIAQSLAFLRMRVDLWREWISSDPARLDAELGDLKGILRDQIRELRRAIFALRPVQFDELGFVGGLHRYAVEFANQHGWQLQVDLRDVPPDLSPEIEAICFRIIQEALTNIAKHAAATNVAIGLAQADHGLQLTVRDDGRGFDPGELAELGADHVGLRQMHERLAGLRGQLTIQSTPGAGAELRVWIPLPVNPQK